MHILVILAHPDPKSFNHAIAARAMETLATNGHRAILRDLCAEGFDPLLPAGEIPRGATLPADIERHCAETAGADGLIIVHPNWWGMPPAVLTGWVDRIMRPGTAYEFVEGDDGEGVPQGLLKAQKAIVFNTSNTEANREETVFGDPLERIWKDCVFGLCGVPDVTRRMFRIICTSTPEERKAWLDETARIVSETFPAEP
ncbi:NAD(P)H-dependent oxidoreductase [Pseudodesulfovibrio indicus]|uniref:NAD(P)H dehydrogenase n=1 Tax=Pseudodesulfovibrio indicus TaxID=1716143 RepID=A0A126QQV6_9BACT|nr:NAD(P)H-dependent oxidoreductase [Pseudodesulfovibrio indicus]AMK11855.1 NAD(P)H dehydrogenase [Pseudodesulfovibrio indicus]TDT87116.1 putative NADPH-quinone reductase [Pseudodesulfovibrio indicus]